MRAELDQALKQATLSQDKRRMGTLRLIIAALRDRDIAARTAGKGPLADDEILELLAKMVKQRQESARMYDDAARAELATQERDEIAIIEGFMPSQLSEAETDEAIAAAIRGSGAASVRDMGKVMAVLKAQHAGRMDFAKASKLVKDRLG